MSCISISDTNPCDGGSAVITLAFEDEDENVVVPSNLQWQLMNKHLEIMNSLSFANNDFTGDTVVLSGDDITLEDSSDSGERYFCVKGLYTSDAGADLPIIGELKFTIQDIRNIA